MRIALEQFLGQSDQPGRRADALFDLVGVAHVEQALQRVGDSLEHPEGWIEAFGCILEDDLDPPPAGRRRKPRL